MSCDGETIEEMAHQGMTDDELLIMMMEIDLAKATAKKEAFDAGMTKREQDELIDLAEKDAKKEAHDRFHRRQADEAKAEAEKKEKVTIH